MKYDEIIDLMLSSSMSINYSSFNRAHLERDVNFSNKDSRLMKSIKDATAKGAIIHQQDQEADPSSFCHIAVNRRFIEDGIKARLYMSPKQANIHKLAIELVNKSLATGSDIYFKYARKCDRLDQMIIYLKNQEDIEKKIALLKKIKQEQPNLFECMHKSKIWFNETEIPNIFLEPEPLLHDSIGRLSSYGGMFQKALAATKTILEYGYAIRDNEDLANKRLDPHFYNNFEQIFTEMLKRYGIYLQKNNETGRYENIARPINPNDLRILFSFNYDRKTQTITETRGGGLYEDKNQSYSYSQQRKKEFFDTILIDEKQVESSKPSGR
ncbi:MAG: hypothetical protein IJW59_00090 [Clostridia bacterium]|nr:hypothetical protein [Clostridia bacterium]